MLDFNRSASPLIRRFAPPSPRLRGEGTSLCAARRMHLASLPVGGPSGPIAHCDTSSPL
jgi:hypothetical protein